MEQPQKAALVTHILLARSSRDVPRGSQHSLLISSHCFNFLSGLSRPLPPHWGAQSSSTDLSNIAPAVLGAQFSGSTALAFPSYSTSSHRARSHPPRFIAKRALTLAWAFIRYVFVKTCTSTAGHSAATRQKAANTRAGDVRHCRTKSPDPSVEEKSQGNFKMLTEVVCFILHSLNLEFFRSLETDISEAQTLLCWQSRVVDCREKNHRNPTDHNSHDRAWSGAGREKQFSQLTLSWGLYGLNKIITNTLNYILK